jgi:predicted enzyme related to lactoylglutathione lyase
MVSDLGYDGGLTAAMGVTDLDRAIDWYRSALGFTLRYRKEEMGWCELATETLGVNIGLSEVEQVEARGGATLTFGVRDIGRARARLEASGVRFDGDTMTIEGMVKLATFFDPDGNKLMLYQDLDGSHESGKPR